MKTSLLVLLSGFLPIASAFSQVLEEERAMSTGSHPALTIILPDADVKFVDSEWKDYMKTYGKISRVKSAKETVASDVQILDIGGINRMDIYNLTEAVTDGTQLTVWIDMGPGFVSSEAYPKEYVASVKFLKDFAHKVKVDMITLELEEQKKSLTKAENNLAKLKRENESLHKVIEDAKKRIAQAEQDIEQNLKDQEQAQKEVGAQTEAVNAVQKKLDECKNE